MPNQPQLLHQRSEEVQDILSQVPRWMIRWGISLIVGLFLVFVGVTFLFRYPEVITGSVSVTATNAPVAVVPNTSGRLASLTVADLATVDSGQVLATITNPATAEEITQLRGLMRAIPAQAPTEALNALIPDSINLGAYQADWNRLIAAINEFNQRVGDPLYREEIRFLEDKVASLQQLKQILSRQKAINDRQLARSREKHDLNRQLYETGGLTRFEYFDSEGLLDAAETSAEGLQKEIVNNDLTINDLQNQRVTKEIEHAEALKKAWRSVQESIRTLNGVLEQWDDTFTLSSPLSGTVSFLRPLAPQDYVKSGEDLLYIIPEAEQTLARGTIPAQRSGLVEVGQRVRIKLIGYPHEQYGYILGVVERIAPIPQEEEYLVQIALPNGLMTHLGTTVEYRPNMPGTLEIVTKDMSLAERFLQAATKQLDR